MLAQRSAHPGLDLEAHDPAAAPFLELGLHGLEVVRLALVVQLHRRVARDSEDDTFAYDLPRKQPVHLRLQQILDEHVSRPRAGDSHETVDALRHLDDGQPRRVRFRDRLEQHRDVEAEVREERKGSRRVDSERSQCGQHLRFEMTVQPAPLLVFERFDLGQLDAALGEEGQELLAERRPRDRRPARGPSVRWRAAAGSA